MVKFYNFASAFLQMRRKLLKWFTDLQISMTLRCNPGTVHIVTYLTPLGKRKRSYSTFIPYIHTKILAYMKPILYLQYSLHAFSSPLNEVLSRVLIDNYYSSVASSWCISLLLAVCVYSYCDISEEQCSFHPVWPDYSLVLVQPAV